MRGKGADEMCSILWKSIREIHKNGFLVIKLWSDNCVAQNTCFKLLAFYAAVVRKLGLKKIVVKTFVVGL